MAFPIHPPFLVHPSFLAAEVIFGDLFASDILRPCLCFLETWCGYQTPFPLSQGGGGKGYWPNFDNRGDFMSFDTHIRTRPKSLLHLYSSIWDAHQVLNPPFFPHVKKQKQTIFPGDNAPLPPPTPCPPHKISNAHPFHIFLLPCSKQNNNTRMPLAKRPYSVLFFILFFFSGRGNPHTPRNLFRWSRPAAV